MVTPSDFFIFIYAECPSSSQPPGAPRGYFLRRTRGCRLHNSSLWRTAAQQQSGKDFDQLIVYWSHRARARNRARTQRMRGTRVKKCGGPKRVSRIRKALWWWCLEVLLMWDPGKLRGSLDDLQGVELRIYWAHHHLFNSLLIIRHLNICYKFTCNKQRRFVD